MRLRIRPRRCPSCRAALAAEAGRPWLTCPDCPLAAELGTERIFTTHRPEDEARSVGPRLPFWLFRARRGPVWIAAFHCFNQPQRPDVDRMLTQRRYDPPLVQAPLGARLARGPEDAGRLAAELWSSEALKPAPWLVSLAAREEDGHVIEVCTGWRVLTSLVRPWR